MKNLIKILKSFVQFLKNKFGAKKKEQKQVTKGNQLAELKIKIEEVPNADILVYHISDPLTNMILSFNSENDLMYGGLHSINHEKVIVDEELQYLAGALLAVEGLLRIDFQKYEIRFEKSPVFDWYEIE